MAVTCTNTLCIRLPCVALEIEVFDAGMRPRLVAAAQLVGPRALPVLKELLDEKDDLL